MGKAGKERKKRRLGVVESFNAPDIDNEIADDGEQYEAIERESWSAAEEDVAIEILSVLGRYPEVYQSKVCKPLRFALVPLLKVQCSAYFEPPVYSNLPPLNLTDVYAKITSSIDTVIRVATALSTESGLVRFASPERKNFRRALHPLVKVFKQQQQPSKPLKCLQNSATIGSRNQTTTKAEIIDQVDKFPAYLESTILPQIKGIDAPSISLAPTFAVTIANDFDGFADLSLSGQISHAFRLKDWRLALALLYQMKAQQKDPKLGSLQRWVRDCDLAAHGDCGGSTSASVNMSLLLLDAVMRLSSAKSIVNSSAFVNEPRPINLPEVAVLIRHPAFSLFSSSAELDCRDITGVSSEEIGQVDRSVIHVVHHTPGPLRRPPSVHDAYVYRTDEGAIKFCDINHHNRQRHDIPMVPGAFVISDVLSQSECRQLIATAEAMGYAPDAVDNIDNVVWLADDSLLTPIFQRCQQFLPSEIGGCSLCGVNARWRLFRYYPEATYRPHIDGAWPGSGLDSKGLYTDDAFGGQRYSKLTFLVYLNGGFEGGATTFFVPNLVAGPGHLEARGVEPRQGSVLCFPHGDAEGSLVHEGSEVAAGGVKYVIRSDVLYTSPKLKEASR